MARSPARTVAEYLKSLPSEQRNVVSAVRDLIRRRLPRGYEETMNWGMIAYELPLARYPDTYNGQPLGYAALAAQKNNYALYLLGAYSDPAVRAALEAGFKKAGKTLDMGKSCLRFRSLDDLPQEVVGRAIASTPPAKLIALYEKSRSKPAKKK
jgi:hypothetical protein